MTYKQQYEAQPKWQDRVIIMNLFHHLQVAAHKKWRILDTAEYFDVSIGLVSENLKLAQHMEICGAIEKRDEAITFVRAL